MDSLNDRIMLVVAILAVVSIIPGMVVNPAVGWVEGVFIIVALFIQVLITAWNDYAKDSKFINLQSLNREESLPVLRGKNHQMQTVSIWKLVVGDMVQLKPGDKVPADCLVVESVNLHVKEAFKNNEDNSITFQDMYKDKQQDPFMFADSYIKSGTCKALVCCVGENSTRGVHDVALDVGEKQTELMDRLDNIGGSLKFLGLIGALIVLGTSLLILFLQTGISDDVNGSDFTKKLVDNIVIAVVMLIVSIPEGLPMTVSISLAHSVLLMHEHDHVLVRDLESVENVGQINELCLGKTGTMTTEEMSVVSIYAQNMYVLNSRKNTVLNCNLDESILEKIKESIVFNSQAYIEMTENSFYVPVGNGTEVSLIKWLQEAEIPVHEIMDQRDEANRVLAQVPFNSALRRSIIAVQHPTMADTVRIYVKGAPEYVLPKCQNHYNTIAEKVPLQDHERNYLINDTMVSKMTSKGLRVMAFSYTDIPAGQFESLR